MYTLKFTGDSLNTFDEPCVEEVVHVIKGIAEVKYKDSRDRLLKMGFIDITDQATAPPEEEGSTTSR